MLRGQAHCSSDAQAESVSRASQTVHSYDGQAQDIKSCIPSIIYHNQYFGIPELFNLLLDVPSFLGRILYACPSAVVRTIGICWVYSVPVQRKLDIPLAAPRGQFRIACASLRSAALRHTKRTPCVGNGAADGRCMHPRHSAHGLG